MATRIIPFVDIPARPGILALVPPEHIHIAEGVISVAEPILRLVQDPKFLELTPKPASLPPNFLEDRRALPTNFDQYAQMLEIQQTLRQQTNSVTFITPPMTRFDCGDPIVFVAGASCTNCMESASLIKPLYKVHSTHTDEHVVCKNCLFTHMKSQEVNPIDGNNGQFQCFLGIGCPHSISEFQVMKIFSFPIGGTQPETGNTLTAVENTRNLGPSSVPVRDYRPHVFEKIFRFRLNDRFSRLELILQSARLSAAAAGGASAAPAVSSSGGGSSGGGSSSGGSSSGGSSSSSSSDAARRLAEQITRYTELFRRKSDLSIDLERGLEPLTGIGVSDKSRGFCPYCLENSERESGCFHMSHTCSPDKLIMSVATKYPMGIGGGGANVANWCGICCRPVYKSRVGDPAAATGEPHYRLTTDAVSTYQPNSGSTQFIGTGCRGWEVGGWGGHIEYAARVLTIRDELIRNYRDLRFDATPEVKRQIAAKIDENLTGRDRHDFKARVQACIDARRWDNPIPTLSDIEGFVERRFGGTETVRNANPRAGAGYEMRPAPLAVGGAGYEMRPAPLAVGGAGYEMRPAPRPVEPAPLGAGAARYEVPAPQAPRPAVGGAARDPELRAAPTIGASAENRDRVWTRTQRIQDFLRACEIIEHFREIARTATNNVAGVERAETAAKNAKVYLQIAIRNLGEAAETMGYNSQVIINAIVATLRWENREQAVRTRVHVPPEYMDEARGAYRIYRQAKQYALQGRLRLNNPHSMAWYLSPPGH